MALARSGCRLSIDGKAVVECPAGVPFVPAVHRPAPESRVVFKPAAKHHRMRLELLSREPQQEATVFLAALNQHPTTWDGKVLPHAPSLPTP